MALVAASAIPSWSVADTLDRIVPGADALLTPRGYARAHAVAANLPAPLSRWTFLECRLSSESSDVDVIVRVERTHAVHLRHAPRSSHHGSNAGESAGWRDARCFAGAWAVPGSVVNRAVQDMWLEFDTSPTRCGDPVMRPGMFADLSAWAREMLPGGARVSALLGVLDALEHRIHRRTVCALTRLVRALPGSATLAHLGRFAHREAGVFRACVAGLRDHELLPFLSRAGWPGATSDVEAFLTPVFMARARPDREISIVHLDIGEAIHPTIAFEIGFSRVAQRHGVLRERALVDVLVERGLCLPDKRDALLAWPSRFHVTMPHELWPSRVTRRVNHVKISWRPGSPPVAKVYLAAFYRACAELPTPVSIE